MIILPTSVVQLTEISENTATTFGVCMTQHRRNSFSPSPPPPKYWSHASEIRLKPRRQEHWSPAILCGTRD